MKMLVVENALGISGNMKDSTHESLRRANDPNGQYSGSEDRRGDDDGKLHDDG